jgi:taurine--2-oxoglutarate transaminase
VSDLSTSPPTEAVQIAQGDGCYFIDNNGKRYLDFNSMAMCSSLGHTVDPTIIDAVVHQLKTVAYAYPGYFITEIRAKLSKVCQWSFVVVDHIKLLADITPGDLNTFVFPSGGTEANETAIRMARLMTKRQKVCKSQSLPSHVQDLYQVSLIPRRDSGQPQCHWRLPSSVCW